MSYKGEESSFVSFPQSQKSNLRLVIMSMPGMPAPKQIQETEATVFSKENLGSATFVLVLQLGVGS